MTEAHESGAGEKIVAREADGSGEEGDGGDGGVGEGEKGGDRKDGLPTQAKQDAGQEKNDESDQKAVHGAVSLVCLWDVFWVSLVSRQAQKELGKKWSKLNSRTVGLAGVVK